MEPTGPEINAAWEDGYKTGFETSEARFPELLQALKDQNAGLIGLLQEILDSPTEVDLNTLPDEGAAIDPDETIFRLRVTMRGIKEARARLAGLSS